MKLNNLPERTYEVTLVNPLMPELHRRLGITDERALELENQQMELLEKHKSDYKKAGGYTFWLMTSAKLSRNDNEFALLCFSAGASMVATKESPNSTPFDMEQFIQYRNKVQGELAQNIEP